jgi:hypothetical protein
MKEVIIAWASRKRHIFIDGKLICETKHKGDYSRGGHYCSYDLSGLPKHPKDTPDVDYKNGGGCHTSGIIPFKPLSEIDGIITRSICNKCQKAYAKFLNNEHEVQVSDTTKAK